MSSLTSRWFRLWQARLASASTTSLRNTAVLCAFNSLIDRFVYYDTRVFAPFVNAFADSAPAILRKSSRRSIDRVDSPDALLAALLHSFHYGKAMHVPTNFQFIDWLARVFPNAPSSIGGQAGIISNQLALLGAKPVLYTAQLSQHLARLFSPRVKYPVAYSDGSMQLISIRHAASRKEHSKINWIFEYQKGDVLEFGNQLFVAPRSNRIILSSPYSQPPLFKDNLVHHLPELGERVDAAIISGYHSLKPRYEDGSTYEYYLGIEEMYLKMLRSHKHIPIHLEYVSTPYSDIDKSIYAHVTRHVESFGVNEIELVELAEKLGFKAAGREIVKAENAVTIHAAAEKVMNTLNLRRIHVHNLGYHVVLLKKPIDQVHQHRQVKALMYASLAATSRAAKGGDVTRSEVHNALEFPVSDVSFNQMARFCSHLDLSRLRSEQSLASGIFDMHDHIAIIAPGQIAPLVKRTTGLGDVVSSCAFLAGL